MSQGVGLIVDGHNLLFRAHFPGQKSGLTTEDGRPSGTLHVALKTFFSVLKEVKPAYMMWVFDHGRSTYRSSIRPEYKANRKRASDDKQQDDDGLKAQFEALLELFDILGVKVVRERGMEADDIIATTSRTWTCPTVVLSNDHDLLQLASDRVTIASSSGTRFLQYWTPQDIEVARGLPPERLAELWALMGDTGDNVIGLKGIGPAKGKKLLDKHNGDFMSVADSLDEPDRTRVLENYLLISLNTDIYPTKIPESECNLQLDSVNKEALMGFFDKWNLDTLAGQCATGMLY